MKTGQKILHIFFLFLLFSAVGYGQPAPVQHNRVNNACGVTAVISPGGDSVTSSPITVMFTSASINATSYKFIIDQSPFPPNTPVNYGVPTGLTEVKLVAYNGNCTDTAKAYYFYPGDFPPDTNNVKMYYGRPGVNEYLSNFIPLRNGGALMAGDRTNNSFQYLPQRGFLIKTKATGCVEWSLMFDSTGSINTSTTVDNIDEAADGGFFVSGKSESNLCFVMKLSAAGNMIWSKKLYTPPVAGANFAVTGLKAMPDGGFVITGAVWGDKLYIARLDANGNITWQKQYSRGLLYSAGLRHLLLKDGVLYAGGVISYTEAGNNYSNSLLLKLDYATGQTLWTRYYYTPARDIIIRDLHSADTMILMNTITGSDVPGNYPITSFVNTDTAGTVINATVITETQPYFVVRSQIVPLPNKNYYVLSAGTLPLPLQPYVSYQTKLAKLDSAYNIIWSKHHAAVNLGQYFYAASDADESMVIAGNEVGSVNAYYSSQSAKIVVRKIDSSGIAPFTSCTLYDQPMAKTPITVLHQPFSWTSDVASTTVSENLQVVNYSFYPELRYKCPDYVDSCSFLKVTGPRNVCNLSDSYTYTIHKTKGYGQPTQWNIPSSVSILLQTDTAITVRFTALGSYTIAATLPFGCAPVKDSVKVLVASNIPPLNLGADTSLCPSTSTTLHAGPLYLSYLWQNGSTDSLFQAGTPGIYWVEVKDSCGNLLRDSVTITAAAAVPLSLGPDRTMCKGDTLHLDAPSGFLNYTWSPNYNISSTVSQHVIVSPVIDTAYYLKAEKTTGCFGFDTVRITIQQAPPIQLGADKSFCTGDSAVLNAGPGFASYQWNNGQISPQITVYAAGSYSVIGTAATGCRSYDTLRILNVYPLPVISLNKDTTLCTGDIRVLDAGAGHSSYLWSNGQTSPAITVNTTGIYSVHIIDSHGCAGTDSTRITKILPLPAGFLPGDTAICNYGSTQLSATGTFDRYTWSTGSTSPSIFISAPGWYWLQVQDKSNCTGKDSILVSTKECIKGFFMPTGFTPNNDGKNDLLKPLLFGNIRQYQFWVYNRSGQLIFETTDPTKGWDGRLKGQLQDGNVFVWMCQYQFEGEPVNVEKGTAVLIR